MSIGPVQDFIASARTCQDLWFGSWLLSDLSRVVAKEIERKDATLVFPATVPDEDSDESRAIANKILAVLPENQPAEGVAKNAKTKLDERLENIRDFALDRLRGRLTPDDRALADAQVGDLIEFTWASTTFRGADAYEAARRRVKALLARRKNTRVWGKVSLHPEEPRFKSTFDGLRDSVIPDAVHRDAQRGAIRPEHLWRDYRIKANEYLCGVSYVKRLGREIADDGRLVKRLPAFHSTSHIAAAPLLARMEQGDAAAIRLSVAVEVYLGSLETDPIELNLHKACGIRPSTARLSSPWAVPSESSSATIPVPRTFGQRRNVSLDGSLFFEGRLQDIIEETLDDVERDSESAATAARLHLQTLYESVAASGESVTAPPPYYALVLADGDKMGRAISQLGISSGRQALEAHRTLGLVLDQFARSAKSLTEKHGGSLIYAGGDDVLAMVPLHTVLRYAERLREGFLSEVGVACATIANPPTLSIGVAIVHHLQQFVDARELAQRAERLAKVQRSSLAIVMEMRHGITVEVSEEWPENDGERLSDRLAKWVRLLDREEIPDSLVFELEQIVKELVPPLAAKAGDVLDVGEPQREQSARKAVDVLIERAVSRRQPAARSTSTESEAAVAVRSRLGRAPELRLGVAALVNELRIARVLQRSFRAAWGSCPRVEPTDAAEASQ